MSTQFCAVGYIITLYSSKGYVKSCGVRPNFGEVRTPRPQQWLHPWTGAAGLVGVTLVFLNTKTIKYFSI